MWFQFSVIPKKVNARGTSGKSSTGTSEFQPWKKIADYFKVSIDVFFDREVEVNGVMINGEGHNIKSIKVEQPSAHADNLQTLLDEKDKRIKLLEEMVEIYKNRPEEK